MYPSKKTIFFCEVHNSLFFLFLFFFFKNRSFKLDSDYSNSAPFGVN